MPQRVLATMITTTSYGAWLPGDLRGYVEDGTIVPTNLALLDHARSLLAHDPVTFDPDERQRLFDALLSAAGEFRYTLLAAAIESWHAHWLIDHGFDSIDAMVGRLKTRMRQALARGRIWTAGYDHRICRTEAQVKSRVTYICSHPGHRPIPDPPMA